MATTITDKNNENITWKRISEGIGSHLIPNSVYHFTNGNFTWTAIAPNFDGDDLNQLVEKNDYTKIRAFAGRDFTELSIYPNTSQHRKESPRNELYNYLLVLHEFPKRFHGLSQFMDNHYSTRHEAGRAADEHGIKQVVEQKYLEFVDEANHGLATTAPLYIPRDTLQKNLTPTQVTRLEHFRNLTLERHNALLSAKVSRISNDVSQAINGLTNQPSQSAVEAALIGINGKIVRGLAGGDFTPAVLLESGLMALSISTVSVLATHFSTMIAEPYEVGTPEEIEWIPQRDRLTGAELDNLNYLYSNPPRRDSEAGGTAGSDDVVGVMHRRHFSNETWQIKEVNVNGQYKLKAE